MKNLKKLARKELSVIHGGDTAYAFCDSSGVCPPTFPSNAQTYCSDGICYRITGGGNPGGGGCHEPSHFCESWETGCGCIYI
ncbi:bacteriocin-like protein [Chryseobacterium gregarium]|uniref:bacteriocin-like protein n=1 Tax=Chryseobacterium gregarium TaxID=456299 RepID=UPI00041231C2|nr:hypothetical protein [Chryseobacterium gregarium]